jgi:hypothetical protein
MSVCVWSLLWVQIIFEYMILHETPSPDLLRRLVLGSIILVSIVVDEIYSPPYLSVICLAFTTVILVMGL